MPAANTKQSSTQDDVARRTKAAHPLRVALMSIVPATWLLWWGFAGVALPTPSWVGATLVCLSLGAMLLLVWRSECAHSMNEED